MLEPLAQAADLPITYFELAEALPAMVALSSPDGRLIYANRRWLDYTGLTTAEISADRRRIMHPDDIERVEAASRRSWESGDPIDIEYRVRRADGEYRWHLWRAAPVWRDGAIAAWLGSTTDIEDHKRTERALTHEEERFRTIVEAASEGILQVDANARVVYLNDRMAEMLGYVPHEMLGRALGDFMDEESREELGANMERRRSGALERFEFRFRHRLGQDVWALVGARPLYDDAGGFAGSLTLISDITDNKQAEQALQASERRYRTLAEATASVIWATAPNGEVTRAMPMWQAYTGQSWEGYREHGWAQAYHPDDRDELLRRWNAALAAKVVYRASARLWHAPSGAYRHCEMRGVPLLDDDGEVREWIGTTVDVEARHRIEQSVRESQEREHYLAEVTARVSSSLDPVEVLKHVARVSVPTLADICSIGTFDGSQQTRRVETAGVMRGEIDHVRRIHLRRWRSAPDATSTIGDLIALGQPVMISEFDASWIAACAPNREQADVALAIKGTSVLCVPLIARGEPIGMVTFAMTRSGRRYTAHDLALAREVAGRAGIAVDNARLFTQLRDTADRLVRANAAKDEFLGLVSHELRTPITMIYGNAEILERRFDEFDEATRTEALRDVRHEAERLQRIIDNLLVLARLDQGQTVEVEPVLLPRVIERVVQGYRRSAPDRTVVVRCEDETPLALGSPDYVEHVLRNLLSNAQKYSAADTPIDVVCARTEEDVVVRILDRGMGIDAEDVERLFDPFYRSPRAASQAAGVGIGLAVCKRIVEAQGGRLWAEAREGGGSMFSFALPCATEG